MVNIIKVTGADEWSPVIKVVLRPDGHRIVSGSFDATVRLWDAETGKPVGQALTGHTNVVTSVAFSPDGAAHRLRQLRQHGAGVGRRHRETRRAAFHRPH